MKVLNAFLIIFIGLFVFSSFAAAEEDVFRAIVVMEEDVLLETLQELDLEVLEIYTNFSAASIQASKETLEALSLLEGVQSVEMDQLMKSNAQLSGWGPSHINTQVSWNSGYTGKNIKIGVIDSGISPHPDLKIAGGVAVVEYTDSYYDDNGHGTHVAGIIGARDNTIGIKGVAPEAELYAIKVFSESNTGYLSDVIGGIDWGITNKMDILNLSLGAKAGSSAFQAVIRKAVEKNILVIAAAGNQGFENPEGDLVEYPAKYKEVIAVSAVTRASERAFFSAAGPAVDIAAPGMGIRSTYLNGAYADLSGTSMAAPFVSGQAALIKQAYPGLTNDQVRSILTENAVDLGVRGTDPVFGAGLIQASSYSLPKFGKFAANNPAVALVSSDTILSKPERTVHKQKVLMKLKNGADMDVTAQATWTSSEPEIVTADKGTIYFNKPGTAVIQINYAGLVTDIAIEVNALPKTVSMSFTDVAEGYWAYEEIQEMALIGAITGYKDFTFKPESFIKRANVAAMLNRSLKLTLHLKYIPFSDVPESYLYFEDIKAVQQAGIFSGTNRGFLPAGELTRAQMAKVIAEAFDIEGVGENPFPDSQEHWAKEYIDLLYVAGITTGSNGNFEPERKVKRSELAVFMSRAFAWQESNGQ